MTYRVEVGRVWPVVTRWAIPARGSRPSPPGWNSVRSTAGRRGDGASSTGAQAYREAGLNALQLGDEAILYPDSFHLSGPDMRAVRQAVTRARRSGLWYGCAGTGSSPPTRWPR